MKDIFIGIGVVGTTICVIGWMITPFILSNISNTLSDISKSLKELVEIERKKLNRK